jgi:hypothetical protein
MVSPDLGRPARTGGGSADGLGIADAAPGDRSRSRCAAAHHPDGRQTGAGFRLRDFAGRKTPPTPGATPPPPRRAARRCRCGAGQRAFMGGCPPAEQRPGVPRPPVGRRVYCRPGRRRAPRLRRDRQDALLYWENCTPGVARWAVRRTTWPPTCRTAAPRAALSPGRGWPADEASWRCWMHRAGAPMASQPDKK